MFVLFAMVATGQAMTAEAEADRVTSLPTLDEKDFTTAFYSGYLTVDEMAGRNLFYVFVESQGDPEKDPLVFWSNGGPGCSSVGEGLWMEHGPYQVMNEAEGIRPAPYSWNRVANVLYVEHPVGVGFSYSETKSDYVTAGDDKEAGDLYTSLQVFLQRFPQFAKSRLYLSGESYAGEYIPHLAHKIVTGDDAVLKHNLRGMAIGNPIFNCNADMNGNSATLQMQIYFARSLISWDLYSSYVDAGCTTVWDVSAKQKECQALYDDAEDSVGTVNQQLHHKKQKNRKRRLKMASAAAQESSIARDEPEMEANFDPDHKYQSFCIGNNTLRFADYPNSAKSDSGCNPLGDPGRMATYLNRADVQKALHVKSDKIANPTGVWTDCADDWLVYNETDRNILTSYYEPIFATTEPDNFRVLVYSGDEDIATCPAPITQSCLGELPATMRGSKTQNWTAWTHNGITAGYAESYERYSFATIKGAGHTTPQYQPLLTYQLFSNWLEGAPLSS